MIITIQDYLNKHPTKPFIGVATKPEGVTGADFQNALEGYIANNYYNYHFNSTIFVIGVEKSESEMFAAIKLRCDRVYLSHVYEYETLFNSMGFEYEPIENYNMEEKEKITNSGTDTLINNTNPTVDSETIGGHTLTDVYGQDKVTHSGTDSKAPFNSQQYHNLDKSDDAETRESRTDTHNYSQTINNYNQGARHTQNTTDHGHVIDRELSRHGNIGTVTAQDMIKQEREIAMFNLVAIVARDIIDALCVKYKGVAY